MCVSHMNFQNIKPFIKKSSRGIKLLQTGTDDRHTGGQFDLTDILKLFIRICKTVLISLSMFRFHVLKKNKEYKKMKNE